ncbi:MAG: ankyrin repeat domain-containing protein [Candidatus Aminicenantes bacterium]|nr:ankyrin repeat domain-containing protein [Candidatus Aminicenantes bacterium]
MIMMKKKITIVLTLFVFLMPVMASGIHEAARRGDLKKVEELLAKDPGLANARITSAEEGANFRKTPLHFAAEFGGKEIVTLLLANKADVDARTAFGFSPLHYAAMKGQKEVAELLISNGCKLDLKNTFNITPIFLAASQGHVEIVEMLVSKGIDINIKGNNGMTLLHAAALGGSITATLQLIEKGVDINVRNIFGKTPMHFAAAEGHKGVVEVLVANKADLNAKSLDGKTPLHNAEENEHNDIVEFLKMKRADQSPREFPLLKGDYLGQKKPGLTPEVFAPGIVSTDGGEFAGTFSPDGKEFYFTRSGGEKRLQTNTIMVTKRVNGLWTEPEIAPFSGKYFDFEPFITPDGNKLYFGTMRALDGSAKQGVLHQWFLEKTRTGWSEPKSLGSPFVERFVMYPTVSKNKNIYFSGKEGIFMSRFKDGKYQEPEKLGEETVNFFSFTAHPFIAPDESYLIFDAHPYGMYPDIFISFRKGDGSWTRARKIGNRVNTGESEMCPYVSPDGKYFFFSRTKNIYWMSASVIDDLKSKR